MGGEILLHAPSEPLPDKIQAAFSLDDGARLSFHFWWFGYIHLMPNDRLAEHKMTAELGVDPLAPAFTIEALAALLNGRRTRVKSLLLDQKVIAGIGNMYAHDVLFRARLHPDRTANTLSPDEIEALWLGIHDTLQMAVDLGGAAHEQGLHGNRGSFGMEHLLVGYKEGQPCPFCGTTIVKIRTGSTQGFICPQCQAL
jgi:formamidopyrimidine-DNA glycosylase